MEVNNICCAVCNEPLPPQEMDIAEYILGMTEDKIIVKLICSSQCDEILRRTWF